MHPEVVLDSEEEKLHKIEYYIFQNDFSEEEKEGVRALK